MRFSARPIQNTCSRLLVGVSAAVRPSMQQKGDAAVAERGMAAPAGSVAKPKVVIITGPTAVGKTKIGLELAKRLDGEVISADSVQVFNGLDIGSDKVRVPWPRAHCDLGR